MSIFDSFIKGEHGEKFVFKKIKNYLDEKSENYYLLQHVALKDISTSNDIDILLVHPILGIYIIEVKNWESLDNLKLSNPYKQANRYQDILMSLINKKVGNVINVEYKVVFPYISKKDGIEYLKNAGFEGFINNTLFKEDLDKLEEMFKSTNPKIPTKEEFLKLTSFLIPLYERKNIKPIITKDEILFFDYKQFSVLNGYTGGLKIIRGVAGTGKSLILINFIKNILKYDTKKFLVLCFNQKLAQNLKDDLNSQYVDVMTIFSFLKEIGFSFVNKKAGKCPTCGNELVVRKGKSEFIGCKAFPECKYTKDFIPPIKYEILKQKDVLFEIKEKIKAFQAKKKYDYFLADETQDFPPGVVRIIIDEIKNSILFIDEAQKIFPYTMDSIREVLWHKDFNTYKPSVTKDNFRNLYNVYRTPSNISKAAFEILSLDNEIDEYYKKIKFIQDDFLKDINFVLEEGEFLVDNFNSLYELKDLVEKIDGDKIILSFDREDVKNIKEKISNLEVMPMFAVKGLEADNVIIHNFEEFLNIASKNKEFFRQVYVLLTRSKKNIYISINKKELILNNKIESVINILNKYSNSTKDNLIKNYKKPIVLDTKKVEKATNIFVKGAEILGAIVGLISL